MSIGTLSETATYVTSVLGMAPSQKKLRKIDEERNRIEIRRATGHAIKEFAQGVSGMIEEGRTGDTAAFVEALVTKLDELAQKQALGRPHKIPGWLTTVMGGMFLLIVGGAFTGVMEFSAMQTRQANDEARIQDMSTQLQRNAQDEAAIAAMKSELDLLVSSITSVRDRLDREFDKR